MSGLQGMDAKLIRQYSGAYGPFAAGDYAIGEQIKARYTAGTVIWSYQSAHGLVYVVDDHSGWPAEVKASEVQE